MTNNGPPSLKQKDVKRLRNSGLRRRLLNILAVIFLLTLVVIGASVYYFIYVNEQRTWQTRQSEAARFAGEAVAAFIEQSIKTLGLVNALSPADLTDERLIDTLLEQNPALLELIRLDADGELIAGASRQTPVLANLFTIPQSNWFLQAQGGQTYFGNIQISPDNEPYLIMAIPADDGGVIASRLQMGRLWQLVDSLHFGETGQSYVVNSDGKIVAHTDPDFALANTSLETRPEMLAVRQIAGGEWQGSYINFLNIPVVGLAAPINTTNWTIFTELQQSEAYATSRTALLVLTVGLGLLGLFILGVTSRFLSHTVLKPIEYLQAGAVQLGAGDFDHRIELVPQLQAEMKQVALAFNEMADRLQERDAIIAKRTQALRESEARFRQVISSISDHIYMSEITADGVYINRFIAPNVEAFTGYPRDNFTSDWQFWPNRVIHPDDRVAATAQAQRLAIGENSELEYRLVKADGRIMWVRDSGRVERDPESGSLLIFGVVSDITARKQAETALEKQRAFLQQVIDINPHFIFAKDRLGCFTLANQAFAAAYGTTVDNILGKTDADFNPIQSMVERYHQDDMKVIETGQELIIPDHEIINIYGENHWRYTIKRPITDEDGLVYQVLGVATDITFLKQAEESIRLARDEAVKANEFKTRLLANVSHDLRTPLGAILGYIEMLEYGVYGPLTAEQLKIARRVVDSIENLTGMVNSLLDQARLEAGSFLLHETDFEPQQLANQLIVTLQAIADKKNIALNTHIAPDVPALLYGDIDRLQQILTNLVGNALKFTEQGAVEVQIFCPDKSHWAMQVRDTGPGIPKEAQTLIFEPFHQVDGSITRKHGGSGLGLSIVKQLVTLMNGDINITSEVGQGSTFTVILPLIHAQEPVL